MTFEPLPGLPGTGPVPEQFSASGKGTFREGFVVRFDPDVGEPWIGNFQPGDRRRTNRALCHPDGRHVVVVAGGQAYVVDPDSRDSEALPGSWIVEIYELDELHLLLFDHQGIRFEALGAAGIQWRTRRISWDGFRDVAISGHTLSGEAWNPMGDTWARFIVDLRTGATEGGSYPLADGRS